MLPDKASGLVRRALVDMFRGARMGVRGGRGMKALGRGWFRGRGGLVGGCSHVAVR